MTLTYDIIKPHREAGETPAQILARYQYLTSQPIKLTELIFLMNNRKMLTKLPYTDQTTGMKWRGKVVNMMNAMRALAVSTPADAPEYPTVIAQDEAIGEWFSHITYDGNTSFDTTEPAFAASLQSIRNGFADGAAPDGSLFPTTEDFDAIIALGGGQPHIDETVDTIQATIDAYDASVAAQLAEEAEFQAQAQLLAARQSIMKQAINHYKDIQKSAGAAVNEATALLRPEFVEELDNDQLQTRVDSIIASGTGKLV